MVFLPDCLSFFSVTKKLKSNSKYVLLFRGKLLGTNVLLKCHLIHTFEDEIKHIVEQSVSAYGIEMYEHAVPKLRQDFFTRHVGTMVKSWQLKDLRSIFIDSQTSVPTEKLIFDWCRAFPFKSVDHFNGGVRVSVSVDAGEHSVYDHLSGQTQKVELARFVIQMIVALRQMSKANIVHGDLRWENIMYPVNDGTNKFFDVKHECYCQAVVNEFCVFMPNVIKISDWDDGFSPDVPDATQRQLFRAYHVSKTTKINDVYDKLGFLRLLHRYFPCAYVDSKEITSLEPLFSSYVYVCPSTREPLYEKTAVKLSDKWVDRFVMIDKVLQKVYARAVDEVLRWREHETSDRFCLAVEGDNTEIIRQLFRYPYFLDLNRNCFFQAAVAATARFRNNVNAEFYGGVACALNGNVPLGLEMMGISATLRERTFFEHVIKQRFKVVVGMLIRNL